LKPILAIILALALTSCSTINQQTTALNGAVADTLTTAIALSRPGVVESNPIGFPLTIAGKALIVGYIWWNPNDLKDQDIKWLDHTAGSAWFGAAANNLAILLGAATPIALGIGLATGILLYINQPEAKPDR
jgi:hypothetical protein